MGTTVKGDDAVTAALAGLADDVGTLDAWRTIAAEAEQAVSRFAPRRSGALSAGARGTVAYGGASVTIVGRAAIYAGPINWGWRRRNIRAALFMQHASDTLEDRAPALLEDSLNTELRHRGLT